MAQELDLELPQGYENNPHTRIADLCTPKFVDDGKGGITYLPIEDDAFEEISDLLLNTSHKESWSRRPRTYAVLRMMNSVPHMDAFETYGLNDTNFPYRTKRDLPPELQSPDMSELFLWYQKYVLCDVCDLEKEKEGRHISVKDGEKLFRWHAKLGKGQSGDVDKVESRMTGKIYARKRIKRHREMRKEKEAFKRFETELAALKRLNHEHLVRVHGSYTDDKFVALLMSPVADCNLKVYLQRPIQSTEMPTFRRWYGCLINAIAYLKEESIRHKDIKPENILVKGKSVFLTDFGTAWDWSDSKFADSVTKGTFEAYTPRYASPEVMTTGSKSRRSSSDIWSLGIVFLEMTTVLRGKSLREYDGFLSKNGSGSAFPSGNWVAVNGWLEKLIPYYPRTDNEPLQWIKEMIKMDPTTRPTATALSSQIGQAMNGVWCGRCCNGDDSTESITTSEYESQHGDLPDELNEDLQPTVVPQQEQNLVEVSGIIAAIADEDPALTKTQSVLETPFSPGETIGQRMMDNFLNSLDEAELPVQVEINNGSLHSSASQEHVFNAHHSHVDQHVQSRRPTGSTSLFGKVKELLSVDHDTGVVTIRKRVDDATINEQPRVTRENDDNAPAVSPNILEKLQKLTERNFIPEIILETWKGWAQPASGNASKDGSNHGKRGLVRVRSYEDLCRQTESILESHTFGVQDSDRRASDDFSLAEFNKVRLIDFEQIKKGLKEFTPAITWSLPTAPKVSVEVVEEVYTRKQEPFDPTAVLEEIVSPPIPEVFNSITKTPQDLSVVVEDIAPPPYSLSGAQITEPITRNSLKDALNKARGKAPAAKSTSLLTARNLNSLNAEPTQPKRVKVDLQTASVYMKRIHDDAASSVATSVMSTRTRERFKLAGLMLPLQDRSCRYLEQYCREGKADAVRLLLKSGCEPGTTKRRRPGPIFNAVRGATMRHIKCVDALIAKGVNVNVKSQSNGRTPLHYAIEHEAWPGYMRLIYTLLKAGADPNIKDATGDVPLLQILYGGIEPLAEHKRDALALLLTTNFNTDLSISPPSTRNTPLHLAVMHKDPWAVALLLNREVPVNKKNVADFTPLQLAAGSWSNPLSEDQIEILDLLLEKNAKVNVKDEGTGQTPVHTAVTLELDQVLKRLIQAGGDISQKDHSGRSPVDLFEDQKAKHNSGRVCKKCVKVQHVINRVLFPAATSRTGEQNAGNTIQKHDFLFTAGIGLNR